MPVALHLDREVQVQRCGYDVTSVVACLPHLRALEHARCLETGAQKAVEAVSAIVLGPCLSRMAAVEVPELVPGLTLQLKATLVLFTPVAALNGDTQPASDIKYAAIVKLRSTEPSCAGDADCGGPLRVATSSIATGVLVTVHHAGPDLCPTSQGCSVTLSAAI